MDANQRSEVNNQTNNGANEKWTPGSQGDTADNGQPLDHTYPQGLGAQQGNQQRDIMGGRANDSDAGIPGGSMETQINGGSGTVQGITDSHQRQMEQKSGAYGLLEQPLGHRSNDSGTDLADVRDIDPYNGPDAVRGSLPSQSSAQPDLHGGSMSDSRGNLQRPNQSAGGMAGPLGGNAHVTTGSMGSSQSGNMQSSTTGGGMPGPGAHSGSSAGELGGQEAQRGNTQLDVAGSRSMANQQSDVNGVHESNDAAGGLPRSPGNAGADSTSRVGAQTGPGGAESGPAVHKLKRRKI